MESFIFLLAKYHLFCRKYSRKYKQQNKLCCCVQQQKKKKSNECRPKSIAKTFLYSLLVCPGNIQIQFSFQEISLEQRKGKESRTNNYYGIYYFQINQLGISLARIRILVIGMHGSQKVQWLGVLSVPCRESSQKKGQILFCYSDSVNKFPFPFQTKRTELNRTSERG